MTISPSLINEEYAYPATKIYTSGNNICQIKKSLSTTATIFLYVNITTAESIILYLCCSKDKSSILNNTSMIDSIKKKGYN